VIDGGRQAGGPKKGGAIFDGIDLEFDRGARGVVTGSVSVPRVRMQGAAAVLDCSDDPAACAAACRIPEPRDWCSEATPE
jgi:hypothetical protein